MALTFDYQVLRGEDNTPAPILQALENQSTDQVFGAFAPLFGLANNELIVLGCSALQLPGEVREREAWQATARPLAATPLTRQGLYVFRRLLTREESVDELVNLSTDAWETFEGAAGYAAEPIGLFRPPAVDGLVAMMLLTWYDGFASWETSRKPDPQAAENFRRRHALTLRTWAVATRLVGA